MPWARLITVPAAIPAAVRPDGRTPPSTGVIIGMVVAVVVMGAGAALWFKRRSSNTG
ncbi:hypothetical protein [Streptomyces sp. NPDC058401]|uniref:hypothetical protein n=1 Tax=Streptomyces sp. NPDC058401 TaxID=3346480 RepID=UPI00364E9337